LNRDHHLRLTSGGGIPRRAALLVSLIAVIAMPWAVEAKADIVQPFGFTSADMDAYFGQSFTAMALEPAVGTLSFQWAALNLAAPDPVLTADLFDGFGFGGALVATTTTVTVPDTLASGEWVNLTFASLMPLTAGNQYSIRFSFDGVGLRSGGFRFANTVGDDIGSFYFGGHRLTSTGGIAAAPGVSSDLAFRVLSTIPEAQSWLLLAAAASLGSAGCGVRRIIRRGRVS
jgi:hypothetical protein